MSDWREGFTAEEVAQIESEVGEAASNPGFDAEAHVQAVWNDELPDDNPGIPEVDYPTPDPTSETPESDTSSDNLSSENVSSSWSPEVQSMSPAEREYYFAQVGDAMYSPTWSLSGHIEGNTVNGVFVPPSNLSPSETDSSESMGSEDTNSSPSSNSPLSASTTQVSRAVALLSEEAKADLYSQVGEAMYAAGFNLAAHIEANTVNGVFLPPTYAEPSSEDSGVGDTPVNTQIDWLNWLTTNEETFKAVDTRLNSESLLRLPEIDSPEWLSLMQETEGAAANPGFNYAAHVAAITSQTVLTGLTEAEVLTLIAETGKTDFNGFDLDTHREERLNAIQATERILGEFGSDQALGGSEDSLVGEKDIEIAKVVLLGSTDDDLLDASDESTTKVVLAGGSGDDVIKASPKNNVLIGGEGNDILDGGDGIDTAVISTNISDLTLGRNSEAGTWTIQTEAEGIDTLSNVERISAADKSLALDIEGQAGQVYRIYKAAFNRDPMQGDTAGLGYWISQADDGMNIIGVAARFIDSDEFRSTYGDSVSNQDYVDSLYENVLGRAPDEEGRAWWVNEIENNPEKSREKVLADFAESIENKETVTELIGNGIIFDPWLG